VEKPEATVTDVTEIKPAHVRLGRGTLYVGIGVLRAGRFPVRSSPQVIGKLEVPAMCGNKPQARKLVAVLTILLTAAATGFAACTATERNADFGLQNGSGNTATVTVNVYAVGDLVAFTAWCYSSCTPVSLTMGNQTATRTTVSGNPGPGNPGEGQGFIFYILSAAEAGPQTATFTVTGTHSDIQTSYIDFSASSGCTFTHNVDSPLGYFPGNPNDTGPGPINAPSITPSPGDLLFVFTYTSEHVTSVNSPWSCPIYQSNQECEFDGTVNAAGYILSASAGATANNMTDIHNSDSWQALITSFTMSGSGGGPAPPSNLQAVAQ